MLSLFADQNARIFHVSMPQARSLLFVLFGILPLESRADPSDLCMLAARDAAQINAVPISVLIAITQTETGRTQNGVTRPWPWTVNMEGEGHWFADRNSALAFAQAHYDRGVRSFDIGCFQINFRWHGENFASLDQMFDPTANATYAAHFLLDLHEEDGDWSTAAGAFHSRTQEHAETYRARFDAFRTAAVAAGVDDATGTGPLLLAAAGVEDVARNYGLSRRRGLPLFAPSDSPRTPGSLVPLSNGG